MAGFVLLWLLLGLVSADQKRVFQFTLENIAAQNLMPEIVDELNVRVSQMNNRSYLNGVLRPKRIITQFELKWVMDLKKLDNRTMRLFNIRIDGCSFLRGVNKSTFLNLFLKSLEKYVSEDVKCPLKPNFNYTLTNWTLDERDFPNYAPECKIKSSTEIYIKKQKAVILSSSVATECKFRFVFDAISAKHSAPELVEELNCSLVQLRNRSYISGNLILKHDVNQLDLTSYMDFWRTDNKKIRLFNLQMSTCSFLTMVHKNQILSTFSRSFKQHSSRELKCPFKANLNYTLKNWYLDEHDFPSYVPEGKFQTVTEYFIEKKKIFTIMTRGRVIY